MVHGQRIGWVVALLIAAFVLSGCGGIGTRALRRHSTRPGTPEGEWWRVHTIGKYKHPQVRFKTWNLVGEAVVMSPDAKQAERVALWMLRKMSRNVPKTGGMHDFTGAFREGHWHKVVTVERDADCQDYLAKVRYTWRRPRTGNVETEEETFRVRATSQANAELKAKSPVPPREGGGTIGFSQLLKIEPVVVEQVTPDEAALFKFQYVVKERVPDN